MVLKDNSDKELLNVRRNSQRSLEVFRGETDIASKPFVRCAQHLSPERRFQWLEVARVLGQSFTVLFPWLLPESLLTDGRGFAPGSVLSESNGCHEPVLLNHHYAAFPTRS